jgi:hypothetical protein
MICCWLIRVALQLCGLIGRDGRFLGQIGVI